MSTETIIEGNKLIADSPFSDCTKSFETYFNIVKKFHFEILDAEYHTSWDWLMPVYIKFKNAELTFNQKHYHKQIMAPVQAALISGIIENLFIELIAGITWYNQQNKNQ
jgi:hypothetical protein